MVNTRRLSVVLVGFLVFSGSCAGSSASPCETYAEDVTSVLQTFLDEFSDMSVEQGDQLFISEDSPDSWVAFTAALDDMARIEGECTEGVRWALLADEAEGLKARGAFAVGFADRWTEIATQNAEPATSASGPVPTSSTNTEPIDDAFIAGLEPGTYWDFEYESDDANDNVYRGTFRIELGSPARVIDDVTMFPISVTHTGGDAPPFLITEFRYMGSDERGLMGSRDGEYSSRILAAEVSDFGGGTCPDGFWLDYSISSFGQGTCQSQQGNEIQIWKEEDVPRCEGGYCSKRGFNHSEKQRFDRQRVLVSYEIVNYWTTEDGSAYDGITITLTDTSRN
jgi:Zn ribbon nucleic-acid-binding protein